MRGISVRNRSLRLPPWWADDQPQGSIFSYFETPDGEQWAFLATEEQIIVASSAHDWKEHEADVLPDKAVTLLHPPEKIEKAFGIGLNDHAVKMWIVACLTATTERFGAEP